MSTKHAPKTSAGKAGLKHRNSSAVPAAASGRIPVLIRMPDVRDLDIQESDVDSIDSHASRPAAAVAQAIDQPKSTGPIASPEASPAASSPSTHQTDPLAAPVPNKREKSFSIDMSRFNLRRYAWPAGAAVGLILLFVIAYGLIAGGGDSKQPPQTADSAPPLGVSQLNEMELSVDRSTQSTIDIIPSLPPAPSANEANPIGGSSQEQNFAAAQSQLPSASQPAEKAQPAETPVEPATPSEANLVASNPAETAPIESNSNAARQAETMEKAGTIEQTSAIDPQKGNSNFGEDLAANERPTAGTENSGYKYPVSNPANFQYPPDYHKIYDAKFKESGEAFANSPTSDRLQQYDNPRLGSRLQPPPVR